MIINLVFLPYTLLSITQPCILLNFIFLIIQYINFTVITD